MLTFTPVVPEAQGQTRTGAQNQRPAATAANRAAARPAATRPAATRPTGARRAAATRPAATRPAANRPAARTATRTASRPAATRPASGQRAAPRPAAAVPYSAPRNAARSGASGRQTAAQRCTTRNGRRVCTRTANASFRWAGDLPPAAMNQRACPEGTMATNAIGHSDITRCVPL
ncbi:hypothetical protein [Roseococcus suduntuyensis]|uniref:Uncharacterized protein n=1 Tax=Roseococcus suduntuyensis TaxID=455361 RepID=A0A840AGV1_9PROT|nr:hypothetical protein [Roseococcus suduntuyensis]MBB3899394.1 hypothetical protein [Roseococcus suduntuyensis]